MRTAASERWARSLSGLLEKRQPVMPARGDRPGNPPIQNQPGPFPSAPIPVAESEGELAQAADMHAPGHADPAPSATINAGEDYEMVRQ